MAVKFQVNPPQPKSAKRNDDNASSRQRSLQSADDIVKSLFPEIGNGKSKKTEKSKALVELSQLNDLLVNAGAPVTQANRSGLSSTSTGADAFAIDRLLALQESSPSSVQTTLDKILGQISNKAASVEKIVNQVPDKNAALAAIEKILASQAPAPSSSSGSILSKVLGAQDKTKTSTKAAPAAAMDPMTMIMMMLFMKKRKKS